MVQALSSYIRNIAVFLIFMGFAGVLSPDGKYRDYINLTLGVILVIIVLSPVINLFAGSGTDIFDDLNMRLQGSVISGEHTYLDEAQNEIILESYGESLTDLLIRLIENEGEYEWVYSNFVLGRAEENFGAILELYAIIAPAPTELKTPLIRIEPIKIGRGKEEDESVQNTDKIKNMKKMISDFYNISTDNIYITVQKTN